MHARLACELGRVVAAHAHLDDTNLTEGILMSHRPIHVVDTFGLFECSCKARFDDVDDLDSHVTGANTPAVVLW